MAAAKGERLAPLFAFVLYSGLRHGEVLGLRWDAVDMDTGTITVRSNLVEVGPEMVPGTPKSKRSTRTFVLLERAVAALRRQHALQAEEKLQAGAAWRDQGLVFTTHTGGALDMHNVDRAFRRVRERAGVRNLPLYSMRHATASILLGAGVPVAVAAKMMGRSVTMFCETYADLLVEATYDAARQADEWLARRTPLAPDAEGGACKTKPRRPGRRAASGRR